MLHRRRLRAYRPYTDKEEGMSNAIVPIRVAAQKDSWSVDAENRVYRGQPSYVGRYEI